MKQLKKILPALSVFDLIFFSFVAVVCLGFFLFFYRRGETVTIRVKVTDQDVLYANTRPTNAYANQFSVGDVELDMSGKKITEIIGVQRFPVTATSQAVYVDMNVLATYDSRTKKFYVRGKQLAYGTPMRFQLNKVFFDGIVTRFPGVENDVKTEALIIEATQRGVEPGVADALSIGSAIVDSEGRELVKLLNVESRPAEMIATNIHGDVFLRKNPIHKDVIVTVSVLSHVFENANYMLDFEKISVGKEIPLAFGDVNIMPIITKIHRQ